MNGCTILATKMMLMVHYAIAGSWSYILFMWAYFVLMWNLMSRSDSVASLMIELFGWKGDSMLVQEQGHKVDIKVSDKEEHYAR